MFRKVCVAIGAFLLMGALIWGVFFPPCLWAALPAFILMGIGCVRMTDDE